MLNHEASLSQPFFNFIDDEANADDDEVAHEDAPWVHTYAEGESDSKNDERNDSGNILVRISFVFRSLLPPFFVRNTYLMDLPTWVTPCDFDVGT